jgi:hypothetical protein
LAAIRSAGHVIDAAAAATDDPRKNSRRSKRFIMPPPGSYVALSHILGRAQILWVKKVASGGFRSR